MGSYPGIYPPGLGCKVVRGCAVRIAVLYIAGCSTTCTTVHFEVLHIVQCCTVCSAVYCAVCVCTVILSVCSFGNPLALCKECHMAVLE